MKNILIVLILALGITAITARAQYTTTKLSLPTTTVTTNALTDVIDLTDATSLGLDIGFTGQSLQKTTVLVGLTNLPANGNTFTIALSGVSVAYMWTNAPVTNVAVLSALAPLGTIQVLTPTTNGHAFTIALNNGTNVFTFTNAPVAPTDVQTNSDAATSATNLFNALNALAPRLTPSYSASDTIQLTGLANDRLILSATAIWASVASNYVFTVTNNVATNGLQIAYGATPSIATTNLSTRIATDYPNINTGLIVSYVGPTNIQIVTPFGDPFTLSASSTYSTNLITTNQIGGIISLLCSNSFDKVTWYHYMPNDFSIAYNSNNVVNWVTNFGSLGSYGYFTYSVSNGAAAHANPQGFSFKYSKKKGL